MTSAEYQPRPEHDTDPTKQVDTPDVDDLFGPDDPTVPDDDNLIGEGYAGHMSSLLGACRDAVSRLRQS